MHFPGTRRVIWWPRRLYTYWGPKVHAEAGLSPHHQVQCPRTYSLCSADIVVWSALVASPE